MSDHDRVRRVADALVQGQRDMIAADLAELAQARVDAGTDKTTALREAAADLVAQGKAPVPVPDVVDAALEPAPIPAPRLAGAVFSLVMSTAIAIAAFTVAPRFKEVFDAVDVPIPGMTVLLLTVTDLAIRWWPVFLALLVGEGLLLILSLRKDATWLWVRTTALLLLFMLHVMALFLPILSLLQGIGRNK